LKILINDNEINFEIENEKSFSDIIESLKKWASEKDLISMEYIVNDQEYNIDDTPDVKLEDIKEINFLVQSKADVVLTSLEEGIVYCDKARYYLNEAIENNKFELPEIENIKYGIEWLGEVYLLVADLLKIDCAVLKFKDKSLSEYIKNLLAQKEKLSELKSSDEAIKYFKNDDTFIVFKAIFKIFLMSEEMKALTINSIDSPDEIILAFKNILEGFEEIVKNIQNAAIAFQTGKDEDGVEMLNKFIDFVYKYIRASFQSAPLFNVDLATVDVDGQTMEEQNSLLQDLLSEVVEIMENDDIISLADILEYEIMPAVENINSYIEILLEKIAG